jgi:hypothetical protein
VIHCDQNLVKSASPVKTVAFLSDWGGERSLKLRKRTQLPNRSVVIGCNIHGAALLHTEAERKTVWFIYALTNDFKLQASRYRTIEEVEEKRK